jgi:DNA-binding HxlR family transcriptional regulator
MLGDKWTLLIVRDLAAGPKRTTELIDGLFPISAPTLVARVRDMVKDRLINRIDYGGNPPHVEYELTERGLLLLPLLDALRTVGQALECNECEDRKQRLGWYCEACPLEAGYQPAKPEPKPAPSRRPERDDSIVLL